MKVLNIKSNGQVEAQVDGKQLTFHWDKEGVSDDFKADLKALLSTYAEVHLEHSDQRCFCQKIPTSGDIEHYDVCDGAVWDGLSESITAMQNAVAATELASSPAENEISAEEVLAKKDRYEQLLREMENS